MTQECSRIADQLRRAFGGDAWHGPPIRDALAGVTAGQALTKPLPGAHSVWELLLHIEIYVDLAQGAAEGTPMPRLYGTEKDWPAAEGGEAEWPAVQKRVMDGAEQLAKTIEGFGDSRLTDIVPGRAYDFYHLFHGIVQHSLYHAGQIAMLKRAVPVGYSTTTTS